MFSEGAIPVIGDLCRVIVPLTGMVAWLLGWLLHGLGGPTRPFLWFAAFAIALVPGWALTRIIGSIEAGASGIWTANLLWISGAVIVIVILMTARRVRVAGLLIAGVALPWVLIFCTYLVDIAQGLHWDPRATILQLGAGIVPLVIGLGMAVAGERVPAPSATAAPGMPGSRRIGSLTRALFAEAAYGEPGQVLVLVPAAWVLVRIILGAPLGISIATALGALVLAAELELRWMPPSVRAALEAYHQIGLTELARFRVATGQPVPVGGAGLAAWLAETPETDANRPWRVEILTSLGRWAEAEAAVGRLDPATPELSYRRSALLSDLEWRRGGPADDKALHALAAAIGPENDPVRRAAEGQLAWHESEVRLAAQDQRWKDPLIAFRAKAPFAAGLHARMRRVRAWREEVVPGAVLVLLVAIADGLRAGRA